MMNPDRALVILSGGQDSTTCLFWAKQRFASVHALTFDYGQRHKIEIEAAKRVASLAKVQGHEIFALPPGILASTSPLVDLNRAVGHYERVQDMPEGVEPTFIPCRNLLFLTLAANRAVALRAQTIVIGVSQEDYGGYPDCRYEFLVAAREALNLAVFGRRDLNDSGPGLQLEVSCPLLTLTKAATVGLALELPGCYEALAFTHTCYDGEYPPNPFNHASKLRAKGFLEAGAADPLILRAKQEGLLPPDYPDHGLVETGVA